MADDSVPQAEFQALSVMKDIAEVLKTAVSMGGGAVDMSSVTERIDQVLNPLAELNARGAFSASTSASFEKLRDMVAMLRGSSEPAGGAGGDEGGVRMVSAGTQHREGDEAAEAADEAAAAAAAAAGSGQSSRAQIQEFLTMLLLQIGELHKLEIIDDEMRGILKDLLIIGQLKKVSEALNDIKRAALQAAGHPMGDDDDDDYEEAD